MDPINNAATFAERIHARYPEGLTGAIAVGGTRTTYILKNNHHKADPGQIPQMGQYAGEMLDGYLNLARMFFDLGGQNLILATLSHQAFYHRGAEYSAFVSQATHQLMSARVQAFYQDNAVDPYFVGIDTLIHLPADQPAHQLGADLAAFQKGWPYQAGRRKLLWEIAPIPLYAIARAALIMGSEAHAAFEAKLAAAASMEEINRLTYEYYARAVYGTDIPFPHFYLGSNRKGDLKLRSIMPIALLCGGPFRLFYTPYPSLFTTPETLQAILEDLAFGKSLDPLQKDYSGQYTSEMVEAEYQHILDLRDDPLATVGLLRPIAAPDNA